MTPVTKNAAALRFESKLMLFTAHLPSTGTYCNTHLKHICAGHASTTISSYAAL